VSQEQPGSSVHWALDKKLTLHQPLERVWQVLADTPSWYAEYDFSQVEGPRYSADLGLQEGQIFKVVSAKGLPRTSSRAEAEADQPEYFIQRIVKVVPEQALVSLLCGAAYDWRQYTSFYVWRVVPEGARTSVAIECYGQAEFFIPVPAEELPAYQSALESNWHRSWSEALANLAHRCEQSHGGRS
jgi:hypothetical protein